MKTIPNQLMIVDIEVESPASCNMNPVLLSSPQTSLTASSTSTREYCYDSPRYHRSPLTIITSSDMEHLFLPSFAEGPEDDYQSEDQQVIPRLRPRSAATSQHVRMNFLSEVLPHNVDDPTTMLVVPPVPNYSWDEFGDTSTSYIPVLPMFPSLINVASLPVAAADHDAVVLQSSNIGRLKPRTIQSDLNSRYLC